MSIEKYLFVLVATLSPLAPAAAAQCATDLTDSICNDQVTLAANTIHAMSARSRSNAGVATPLVSMPTPPTKMVRESVMLSEEGSAMRWIYSTVANKRVFAMYSGPQRGRPAELRVTVRLSLL